MRKSFTRLSSFLVLFFLSVQLFAAAPQLATNGMSPKDDATTVPVDQSEFTLTFKQAVALKDGGAIGLYDNSGNALRVFQVGTTSASGAAVLSSDEKTVTITFSGYTLKESSTYHIRVEGKAIVDKASGDQFLGADAMGEWNFKIKDTKGPMLADKNPLDPKVDAKDVNFVATAQLFTMTFNESVMLKSALKFGDVAVYTSTNGLDDEEGGDLVTLGIPTVTQPSPNQIRFQWPNDLLDNRDLYVRVKPGVIVDATGNAYAGINDNDTWTFTTKDVGIIKATVNATNTPLHTNSNFTIDFDEDIFVNGTKITPTNAASKLSGVTLVDQDGAAVDFKLTYNATTFTITLDPKSNLAGTKFTARIDSAVVRDIAGNVNDDASKEFTAGDWTAPTFEMATTNYSGTTFDIMVKNASEVCNVKYIVTKPVPADVKDQTFAALFGDVLGRSAVDDNDSIIVKDKYIHYHRSTATSYSVKYVKDDGKNTAATQKIDILAEGTITVSDNSLEVLERVINLPASNGQKYVVWAVGYDNSTEGVYVPDYSSHAAPYTIVGNINTGVVSAEATTIDILMPNVYFQADTAGSINFKKVVNSKKKDGVTATGTNPADFILDTISKKAGIKIVFDEDMKMANGADILSSNLASIVTIENQNSTAYGIDEARSSYDGKELILYADSSYKSQDTITVTIAPSVIEDANGNELQPSVTGLLDQRFFVEEYLPVLAKFDPPTDSIMWEGNAIVVEFSKPVFVPADDEPTAGVLTPMSNSTLDPLYVGEYVDITEGSATSAGKGDVAVKDEFVFTISEDNKKITITRETGEWSSETWYYVEVEPSLLDEDRSALSEGAAINTGRTKGFERITTGPTVDDFNVDDNHTISFKYGDVVPPTLTFFEPAASNLTPGSYSFSDLDGVNDMAKADSIGVLINEWVKLGFADEIEFDKATQKYIVNPVIGNSFRRYFKLESGGEEISFDVKGVEIIGTTTDSMILYLDPYYADAKKAAGYNEADNFMNGVEYTVTYISTQMEADKGEAYQDDSDNFLEDEVVAVFSGVGASTTATVNATISHIGGGYAASNNVLRITFDQTFTLATLNNIAGGSIAAEYGDTLITNLGDGTAFTGTTSNAAYNSVTFAPGMTLSDDDVYEIIVADGSFAFQNGAIWPTNSVLSTDSTWRFSTVDKTAPDTVTIGGAITANLIPADNSTGILIDTDLTMILTEDVTPVVGKKIWIWENGVTQIAQLDASRVDASRGDTIVIDNEEFGNLKWSQDYHVIVDKGAFVDAAGNEFLGFYDETDWNFTTGTDPFPYYTKFTPKTETTNTGTSLSVEFSELVKGVDNMFIRLFESTDLVNEIHSWEADEHILPAGTYSKSFTFTPDGDDLEWGKTYVVQIEAGAFQDADGNGIYACAPSGLPTDVATLGGTAAWSFVIQDVTAPKVAIWPADKDEHVAYNSYLYFQFEEPVALWDPTVGLGAVITDQETVTDHIADFITLTYGAATPVDSFLVEFVDNSKMNLRVTPLDILGHNYKGDNNPTMQTEMQYALSINGNVPSGGTYRLVDEYKNTVANATVTSVFTTEDISAPVFDVLTHSAVKSNSVKVSVSLDEPGTAWIYVIPTPKNAPSTATIVANGVEVDAKKAADTYTKTISLTENTGATKYSVFVAAKDDETDKYADPASMDIWVTNTAADTKFPINLADNVDRIRDILPAAQNMMDSTYQSTFYTCDNDAPEIVDFYPNHNGDEVALDSIIYLIFNEEIELGTMDPNAITLRKSKNNAEVGVVSITTPVGVNGKSDSILIALDDVTPLMEEETWYYLEIDRYAIKDTNSCSSNYAEEWVGKENLSFLTEDNTPPVFDSVYPYGLNAHKTKTATMISCVPVDADEVRFYFSDINGLVNVGTANQGIKIYHSGANLTTPGVLAEIIPMTSDLVKIVDNDYLSIDLSNHLFLSDDFVYIELPANVIADSKGNKHNSAQTSEFATIDNVPPVASWTLLQDEVYFNQSNGAGDVGVFSKWDKFKNGTQGASVTAAPTHTALKVDFDENIQIKAGGEWLSLSNYTTQLASYTAKAKPTEDKIAKDGWLTDAEIFAVFGVTDVDAEMDLVYRSDSAFSQLHLYDLTASSITFGVDTITSQVHIEAGNDGSGTYLTDEYVGSLLSETRYDFTIAEGQISDPLSCSNNRIVNDYDKIVSIETRDDTPPALTISACATNACVSKDGAIVLSFDKPVVKSSYDIKWLGHESYSADNLILSKADIEANNSAKDWYFTLVDGGGTDVDIVAEVQDMQTILVTPKKALTSEGTYTIKFNRWTVKEYIENDPNGTVFEGEDCTFTVEDYKAPTVALYTAGANIGEMMLTPMDDVTAPVDTLVSASSKELKIVFNEGIYLGAGTLEIRRENGQVFEEIDAADCSIQMDKTKAYYHTELIIPFQEHDALEDFTEYYVVMPAGFVTDTADCGVNDFAGFGASLDASTGMYVDGGWNFKTSDKTPPELLSNALGEMIGLYPVPGSVDIDKYTNLRITLDEPVTINANANAGVVIYYDNGDDTEADFGNAVEFIPWGDARITQENSDVYNNVLNDIIVINPTTVFDRKGTYYVRVSGDDVVDGSTNKWSSSKVDLLDEVKDEEWKFTITNDVVPVLIATTPDYDPIAAPTAYESLPAMDEGYVVADLFMKFGYKEGSSYVDLDVDKNTDDDMKVRIYEYVYDPASLAWNDRLWKEYPITDDSIVVEGNMVTIKGVVLRDDMQGDSVYYVTVDAGAITNGNTGSNNWWPGIANGFRWRFQTAADNVFLAGGPAIVSPEIGAVDLTQDNDLVVTFGEGIEALAMPYGMVKVYDADADSVAVAVTVDQSMTEGNTLTVPVTLYDESNFYVVLEEGAFGDTSTNSTPNPVFFADSSWSFATGDNTAPMATITPVDGAACLENEVTLTLSYENENNGVDLGAGLVTVTDTAGVEIAGVVVGAAMVDTTDASMVTVVLSNLPDVTDVLVSIDEGFVADPAGNLSVAVADYLLSIGDNTKPTVAITVPTATVTVDTTVLELTFSEPVNVATLMGTVMVNGEAVEVTSTDSLVYTAVLDTVVSDAANVVVVDADAFVDNGCNALGNDSVSLTFDVADITAPTAMYAPTGVYEGDYMNFELIITFDDMVEAAAGDVVVYDATTDEALDTIAVEDFATLDSISFTAVTEALSYGSFYVMVPAGSFIDPTAAEMGKEYMGTADATDWAFEIVDSEFDNCYDIISPVDGETGVATTTDLVIEFCSERIVAGAGNVYLADLASDAGDIVIPADSLVVEGMTLTIPVANLEEGVTYTVTIEPGTITDEAGNAFMGIVDGDEWNFTTEDATAPMVTLVAGTSMEGDAAEASITSTELGTVYLVAEGTALDAAALAAAVDAGTGVAAAVSFAGEAVMVDVSGLTFGNYVAVAVDLAGNLSEASTDVYVVTEKPVIPVVAISAIQGTGDESPLLGQEVITSGVVTSIDAYGYYIQDANAAWSGVYVYDADNAAILNAGSAVKVQGTVDEYNGLTELKDVVSIDPILMDLKVEAIEVSAIDESYESVRIMISGQAPATATTAFKETATVGDFAVYFGMYADKASYDWKQDYTYEVTGIAKAYNDNWQVQPYFASDIVNASLRDGKMDLSSSIEVYPNPFNEFISIEVSSEVELTKAVITNIAGQIVKEVINPENTIRTQELRNGYYFISLHTEEGIVKSQRLMKR